MDYPGYAGCILHVDLSSGEKRREPLDPYLVKAFIGGYGINNKLAADLIPPDVDPLSPDNAIIIGAGPFAGTIVPGAGKIAVTSRFPLNGAFTTAHGGGAFALMLKTCGYDHVVITGKADKPVYLNILDDDVALCDAMDLWGRDTFETVDELRTRHEPCSVIATGQAGENLVKISVACVDKCGTIGTGGLPAIMGSKNLKAIVASQGTRGIEVAHRLKLHRLVDDLIRRMMSWPGRQPLLENGMMPSFGYEEMHKKTRRVLACPSCPLGEKEVNRLTEGPYAGMVTCMTHFIPREFGEGSTVDQFNWSMKYTDALNRYGVCMLDFNYLISLMGDLYKQGVITKEDTGGIEIKEDFDTTMKLLQMTAHRHGFGDILADGIVGAAQRIGKGVENYACHIKGRSLLYDPRMTGLGTMEFEPMTTPRGSHVGAAGSPSYSPGRSLDDFARHSQRMGAPDDAVNRIVGPTSFNPGRLSRWSEDWYALFGCLSLCNRAHVNRFYHVRTIAELYSAVTGLELSPNDLMKAAERAWNTAKVINVRAGFGRRDDRPPWIWFIPLKGEGGKESPLMDYYKTTVLTEADIDRFLDDYYDERGWDKESGAPTPEKLRELGL
jgi:aldehyde:ferredoxin oxidoreductase